MRPNLHGRRRTISRLAALLGIALSVGIVLSAGMGAQVSAQSEEESVPPSLFLPLINGMQDSSPMPLDTDAEYEYIVIEEDIQVPIDFLDAQVSEVDVAYTTSFWPGGIVPFEFATNVTASRQQAMLAAMAEWERVATVDFRQCDENCSGDHIRIRASSTVNDSWIGRRGGEQIMHIVSWDSRFIMAHELGHALGYWHEQSRVNRDDYITIHLDNIIDEKEGNFRKRTNGGEYGPYDFDSVMHYDDCDFAIDCDGGANPSIIVLAPYEAQQTRIGQRTHLSTMDQLTMSFLYPRANWRFVNFTKFAPAPKGTFLAPYREIEAGVINTPSWGTLWVQSGTYSGVRTYSKPMTIRAPLGGVTLR